MQKIVLIKHIKQRIKDVNSALKAEQIDISTKEYAYCEGRIHELKDLLDYLENKNA